MPSPTLDPLPTSRLTNLGAFVNDCGNDDLIYFLLNVGDGDTQLLLLPKADGVRQALVVDVVAGKKLTNLIDELKAASLLPADPTFVLLVLSHPHADHIGGAGDFITRYRQRIEEVWEPGFYYPSPAFHRMMNAIGTEKLRHCQPTSGTTRYIGQVKVMALAPAISLRNRFDTYGVDVNNASIALKIEFPGRRVTDREPDGTYTRSSRQALILGADAQTLSWAQVVMDFPQLGPDKGPVAKVLDTAQGFEPLRAQVFKVPHHASKHGLNLELVETISPRYSLVSSVGGGGNYGFPHLTALDALREAIQQTAMTGASWRPDFDNGIHYTCALEDNANHDPLGTIALVMSPTGQKLHLWRFGDTPSGDVAVADGRQFT